jgi:hypothetical protein
MIETNKYIQQYAAWNNKKNHPLAKEGTDNYVKSKAEQAVKSLIQQSNDLRQRYMDIKLALDKTNLETKITVADKEMTLAEALFLKREGVGFANETIGAFAIAIATAQRDVERYNAQNSELSKAERADIWYLTSVEDQDKVKAWVAQFMEEVDGQLQIANATTHLVGVE